MHPWCYVFDLDDTLMPTASLFASTRARNTLKKYAHHTQHAYSQIINPDPRLAALLSQIHGNKVLLTNGTRTHAYASMQALGVRSLFYGQVDRDSGAPMKPSAPIYHLLERHMEQRRQQQQQQQRQRQRQRKAGGTSNYR